MKSTHKRVWAVALTVIVAQALDEARSIEYQMKVELVAQLCLQRLSLIALDVLAQSFQQIIGVKSPELSIYEGCRKGEPIGATYDAWERSQ